MENRYFISWYQHWWKKSNSKFWKSNTRFGFFIPDFLWSNFMENPYFIGWYHHWWKNLIRNFENPTPDSDSSYPISFDQTLWKIRISSVGTTIDEKNIIRNFENPTPDSDSPYPITQGPTKFQSFMTNDSHLLIWCSFDPDANRQTNKLFFFIWPSLQSREKASKADPIFAWHLWH